MEINEDLSTVELSRLSHGERLYFHGRLLYVDTQLLVTLVNQLKPRLDGDRLSDTPRQTFLPRDLAHRYLMTQNYEGYSR